MLLSNTYPNTCTYLTHTPTDAHAMLAGATEFSQQLEVPFSTIVTMWYVSHTQTRTYSYAHVRSGIPIAYVSRSGPILVYAYLCMYNLCVCVCVCVCVCRSMYHWHMTTDSKATSHTPHPSSKFRRACTGDSAASTAQVC